ncbi:hypothetical protein [Aquimarina algicola]|uniref:Uncharacterized protein n=1 Tax=Aquimarina algicola TaxID=2589995 RepID=A0A504JLH1_9FLAO|nr:hypothetical protein [Aquimarina algicola]TPN89235.1 hypothetical protein FHK87_03135 [Aquimarina algicola]
MTKIKQLEYWDLFCKEEKSFSDGYFYSLFMEITFNDLYYIYKHFPNSDKLILKTKKYLIYQDLKFEKKITPALLEVLIKLDFEEKKTLFQAHNEFDYLLKKWTFIYEKDFVKVAEMIEDDELSQEFFNYKISDKEAMYALDDALYGLTNDFDYRLYLFEPLTKLNYSGEYMFQFKSFGGIYAISDNIVYYSYK